MTKTRRIALSMVIAALALLVIATVTASARSQEAQPEGAMEIQGTLGTSFTYQGQLKLNGEPVNGACDFQFGLYDALSLGNQVGITQTESITVTDGLFAVNLDFGDVFSGTARWLETAVKCGEGSYTSLGRQELTAAPYALYALGAPWSGLSGVPAGFADGEDDNSTNFWSLTGDAGTDHITNFLGTTDNVSLTLGVSNTGALRLEPDPTSPNVVGGYSGNSVDGDAYGATIGGGGTDGSTNRVTGNYGTVAGGRGNRAGDNDGNPDSGEYTTVGGGLGNTASGYAATVSGGRDNNASGDLATVGGGYLNFAYQPYATVGGGYVNLAYQPYATVGGGYLNFANQLYATIPGGSNNTASGSYSFAAGQRAKANHQGVFVWADSRNFDFSSVVTDSFNVRATGGVTMVTGIDGFGTPNAGAVLSSGGGSWNSLSDRVRKENLRPVDMQALLARLSGISITTWNYKSQEDSVRHIGPMAQDFNALLDDLGGEGEAYINTLDADGVALAAIQGLYARTRALEIENAVLQQQNADLETRVAALEASFANSPVPSQDSRGNLMPWAGIVLVGVGLAWVSRRYDALGTFNEGGR